MNKTYQKGACRATGATRAIVIDAVAHEVRLRDRAVELTPQEFGPLDYLSSHANQVHSRDALLNAVWGYDYAGDTRAVDVHIYWLRRKLEEDPSRPVRFVRVRRYGYKFVSDRGAGAPDVNATAGIAQRPRERWA